MEYNEQNKITLKEISDILMINGGFLDNIGLYSGEMGLVLFFARYADMTHNKLYLEYFYTLIEKVQNKIHCESPIDFKNGLTGIGSTIEYLEQAGYIDVDTDEVLEELDERLLSEENLQLLTINEILDTAGYALWRISGNSTKKGAIVQSYLLHLIRIIEERGKNYKLAQLMVVLLKDITHPESIFVLSNYLEDIPDIKRRLWCQSRLEMLNLQTYNLLLEHFSKGSVSRINNIALGMEHGLAGLGLSLISELEGENYWTSLFPNISPLHHESLPV